MNSKLAIKYVDRRNGKTMTEYPFASIFLHWSYNSNSGRILTRFILSRRIISRLMGWMARRKLSRRFIPIFIKKTGLDKSDIIAGLKNYSCFNDFFIRESESESRFSFNKTGSLIAPADGKLLVYRDINPDNTFLIKRNFFNLRGFLCNDNLIDIFSGGIMIIIRLALSDYHNFHFADSGMPFAPKLIKGRYYAGGSYDLCNSTAFYTENKRMITMMKSDHFGLMAQIEIGAFTVGSIRQVFTPFSSVERGDKKGYFELGGSTIVLLLGPNVIKVDDDLIDNSLCGLETKVQAGDKVGTSLLAQGTRSQEKVR